MTNGYRVYSFVGGLVMTNEFPSFWLDLSGKIGPPIVAATLVACLLGGTFEILHLGLLGGGVLLIWLNHWQMRKRPH